MTRVRFALPPSELDAPVEIYDDDLVLRARVLASQGADLKPGRYHAVARLARGGHLTRSVAVPEGDRIDVTLAGDRASEEVRSPEWPLRLSLVDPSEDPERVLRHARGAWIEPDEMVLDQGDDAYGSWRLTVRPSYPSYPPNAGWALALTGSGTTAQWSVLPSQAALLVAPATAEIAGAQRLVPRLRHRLADEILAFGNRGQALDAGLLGGELVDHAEVLLKGKRADPLAAAAGAMALLAVGDLERLHDWTSNLAAWFPWLADGRVALAEHQSLLGHHEEAVALLRRLGDLGIPVLTVALTTAVNRIGQYLETPLADGLLRATYLRLASYAIACDLTTPVTTFAGHRPDLPRPRHPEGDRPR